MKILIKKCPYAVSKDFQWDKPLNGFKGKTDSGVKCYHISGKEIIEAGGGKDKFHEDVNYTFFQDEIEITE